MVWWTWWTRKATLTVGAVARRLDSAAAARPKGSRFATAVTRNPVFRARFRPTNCRLLPRNLSPTQVILTSSGNLSTHHDRCDRPDRETRRAFPLCKIKQKYELYGTRT